MRSYLPITLSFLLGLTIAANTESGYLATVTLAPTASGADAFDLEEKRAECFQACYKTYGNYGSCTREGVVQCWCNESDDWVEREEDCVWDICGPSAYNLYATVLRRVCETVTASASQAIEMGSTSSDKKVTSTSVETTGKAEAETTSKAEAEKTSQAQVTETSISGSDPTTTSSEAAAAATSSEPNSGWKMGSSLSVSAVLAIGAVYLARMAF